MKKLHFVQLALAAAMLAAFQLPASAAPAAVELSSVAEREVVAVKNGKKEIRRSPVEKAVPGDEIIYTTTFKNTSGKAAGHIVINNPVPNDSTYKAGSAQGANTVVTFSADGGKTFAAAEKLNVTQGGKTRPAQPAEYTHIRWAYKGDLGAGKSGEVSFRAFIK